MTARTAVKRLSAPLMALADSSLPVWRRLRAPVLCYHGVAVSSVPEHAAREVFQAQMRRLADMARCLPLRRVVELLMEGQTDSERTGTATALTFDDGYANLLDNALPVLKGLGLPATTFIVPAFLGSVAPWESPAPVAERRLMNRTELDSWMKAGFEVGGHGWSHQNLSRCTPQDRADELGRCVDFLREELGIQRPLFCYPYGMFSPEAERDVAAAGFSAAVAGGWGRYHARSDLFRLRRIAIDAFDSPDDFVLKVRGGYGWWSPRWWSQFLPGLHS